MGIGKIARDQHLPTIAGDPAFTLAATVSRHARIDGVPGFASLDALLASGLDVDAVSLCTPPAGRAAVARAAIEAGLHVMLEKPPVLDPADLAALAAQAAARDVTLFATWHSRCAAGVAPARDLLAGRRVRHVAVAWREDIRCWHPGQDWILEADGLGVFDPGINALSILTAILPERMTVEAATLAIPANRAAPIAADLTLRHGDAPVSVVLDFLHGGAQHWDIAIDTDRGAIRLSEGGQVLSVDGEPVALPDAAEYPRLYRRFADLIAERGIDADVEPLRLVLDALATGERRAAPAFQW